MTTPADQPPREIVIPLAFGDARDILLSLWYAAATRSWSVVRKEFWLLREHRRRGMWRPFTFGDWLTLRRRRVWWATEPELRGKKPEWRHR